MKNYILYPFVSFLVLMSCKLDKKEDSSVASVTLIPSRTQVVAGSPYIQAMKENLTMNAVTIYTHRENIRATTTGYIQQTQVIQGSKIQSGQQVFSLKTKEAEALGEEILKDPAINITGIIPIVSKNSGIITQVFFQDGDYVVDGDVLAELTKPSSLAVKLFVPYEYNRQVALQKRVDVRLPDGEILNGVIHQLLPSEDITSQTTPYLVTLSPFRFLPENLNVTVTVPTKLSNKALVIPIQALQSNEEQTSFWVMKIVNDTLAIRQSVELGMRTDSVIELKNSQLLPTDQIVVQGAYGLPDTASITKVKQL
jgi:multidrug efflux pump subunit AcrA (membrane-fusion protein)